MKNVVEKIHGNVQSVEMKKCVGNSLGDAISAKLRNVVRNFLGDVKSKIVKTIRGCVKKNNAMINIG